MNATPAPRLARPFGLLVRHWAYNMTLVHDQGTTWPLFGYTPDEQAALRAIARRVPALEFYTWLALVVVFALLLFTGLTLLGLGSLSAAPGGAQGASGGAFVVTLGVQMVACIGVGFPLAMLIGSLLTGALFKVADADLPDAAARTHYVHKLSFQLSRVALLMAGVVLAGCLWLPERVFLLTRSVMPVLGPAVSIATLMWLSLRPKAQGAAADTRDSTSTNT